MLTLKKPLTKKGWQLWSLQESSPMLIYFHSNCLRKNVFIFIKCYISFTCADGYAAQYWPGQVDDMYVCIYVQYINSNKQGVNTPSGNRNSTDFNMVLQITIIMHSTVWMCFTFSACCQYIPHTAKQDALTFPANTQTKCNHHLDERFYIFHTTFCD